LNKLTIAGLSLLTAVAVAAPASADTAWLQAVGTTSGQIKGDGTVKGFEGQMEVLHFDMSASSPYDAATGRTSGRREWHAIKITKALDGASPKLFQAFVTNQVLKTVKLTVLRPQNGPGLGSGDDPFYTIELTNAVVASDAIVGPNRIEGNSTSNRTVEELSLTFQHITVTYVHGGVAAAGDWSI
jgi:type VI secretion system secreted protein Hcp